MRLSRHAGWVFAHVVRITIKQFFSRTAHISFGDLQLHMFHLFCLWKALVTDEPLKTILHLLVRLSQTESKMK